MHICLSVESQGQSPVPSLRTLHTFVVIVVVLLRGICIFYDFSLALELVK